MTAPKIRPLCTLNQVHLNQVGQTLATCSRVNPNPRRTAGASDLRPASGRRQQQHPRRRAWLTPLSATTSVVFDTLVHKVVTLRRANPGHFQRSPSHRSHRSQSRALSIQPLTTIGELRIIIEVPEIDTRIFAIQMLCRVWRLILKGGGSCGRCLQMEAVGGGWWTLELRASRDLLSAGR
ncbi:uncharacterized protein YALI1_A16843g [Yarrowia lipolytica]|uniref:Uncharacterized protein n=1 Tax=Yarrowia lipolytica TaxID=4952 RepID=A0A1D8N529_YARLL|nr:hypothetical protein YALI1_A16843g [Yarrowia lipolytica]